MADGPLAGRTALVTGASGKLGPVWIAALRAAGATVHGLDLRAADGVLAADVLDRAAVEAAREAIGPVDVLVNNAGIDQPPQADARRHAIDEIPLEDFRRTVDVNLAGTFNVTQVFGPGMVERGRGSIVNVGSLYATVAPIPAFYDHMPGDPPFLKPPAYAASKAGVLQLTRYFARLWGPSGVRVNTLSPGGIAGGQDPEFVAKFSARVALGRLGEGEELAGPLVFLASDASSYVTGQELRIDGGFTA